MDSTNYRSKENQIRFASVSQWKAFKTCEASALAELRGEYKPDPSPALIVGNMVHNALLSGTAERAAKLRDELIACCRTHNAEYFKANAMIARVKRDAMCMRALTGEHERIVTFSIDGYECKAQLDVVNARFLCDLKTCRDFETAWSESHGKRVPFYEVHNYWLQLAVYREAYKALRGHYPEACMIVAVTKQDPCDIKILSFDNDLRFGIEIDRFRAYLPRLFAVKTGKELATACGKCDYCREKKEANIETADSILPKEM